jgi:hypothetical protein
LGLHLCRDCCYRKENRPPVWEGGGPYNLGRPIGPRVYPTAHHVRLAASNARSSNSGDVAKTLPCPDCVFDLAIMVESDLQIEARPRPGR